MTDETKKLFDAPWRATDLDYVEDSEGYYICEAETHEQSHRIALLPELYDALMEVAYEHCQLCIYKNSESASKMPSPNDMATNGGASFCFQNCPRLKHWKLLKKVGDGE